MRKALFLTTGLAWLALTGAASAFTVTLSPGPADPQYFEPIPVGESDFTVGTTVWSGTGDTEKGTVPFEYAAPFGMGSSTTTGTTYMAVKAGETETETFATDQTSLTIYWGSIDPGNGLAVTVDGFTLTGADLVAYGASDDGAQGAPNSNQWVTITGLAPFKAAEFTSTTNSFEFSVGSVPEPSTWVMMALGFAGLGYAAFRRNSKKSQMAIGAI
jgi:hypothetical protein